MQYIIVVPESGVLSKMAAEKLNDYIQRVTKQQCLVINDKEARGKRYEEDAVMFLIGNEKRNLLVAEAGFAYQWDNLKDDGYVLKTLNNKTIVAAGKKESGDKYAVYELIKQLKIKDNNIETGNYDVVINPFIKTREVILGDAAPWDPFEYERDISPDEGCHTWPTLKGIGKHRISLRRIVKKYCIENWDGETLKRYMDQLDFYGFNSVQLMDAYECYIHTGFLVTQSEWQGKLKEMMSRARELGNRVTLSLWGNTVTIQDGRVVSEWNDPLCSKKLIGEQKSDLTKLCYRDEKERKDLENNFEYQSGYAPYVDHIISHFVDPGGCNRNGCTIATCMDIMMYFYKKFKSKNPGIQATYNLWPLSTDVKGLRIFDDAEVGDPGRWDGTYTWANFVKVKDKLDKSIMFANRSYMKQLADFIIKDGRKYGVWTWYNADQEITASMHVHTRRLQKEFSSLPKEAGDMVEWYSVPSNCHGLNFAGIYIAARLLWDPYRKADDILMEFCDLVFGPKISRAVFDGYNAIACIRNADTDVDAAVDDSAIGEGTANPAEDYRIASEAYVGLKNIKIDENWVPKIPLVVAPETLLSDLAEHVKMVMQYAQFRMAYRNLKDKGDLTAEDVQNLPKVDKMKESGGMIEYRKAKMLTDYMLKWLICGPFVYSGELAKAEEKVIDEDFLAEQGGEEKIEPQEGMTHAAFYINDIKGAKHRVSIGGEFIDKKDERKDSRADIKGDKRKVSWQRKIFWDTNGLVDLLGCFERLPHTVSYAACYFNSAKNKKAKLWIGTDGSYKVWLNHRQVCSLKADNWRPAPDDNYYEVDLKKGRNMLLIKVMQHDNHGFYLKITDQDNNPLFLDVSTP